jgi:hypothetical protein
MVNGVGVAVFDLQSVGAYLTEVFWDPDSRGFPGVDVARTIGFTLITFIGGWLASKAASRKKIKARLLDDLISTQRELFHRAYPRDWKRGEKREEFTLRPLIERMRFLVFSLKEEHRFGAGDLRLIDAYIARMEEFVALWTRALHRSSKYDDAYDSCLGSLIAIVEITSPRQVSRVAELSARAATIRHQEEAA